MKNLLSHSYLQAVVMWLFVAVLSGSLQAQLACDAPLYATGFDQSPTRGTRDALIHAVARGESIRVGWALDFDGDSVADLTHWANADYLSIWQGEVFTQVAAIQAQIPDRTDGRIKLMQPFVEWRGSIGTTGELEGRFSDDSQFPDDINVEIMWCSESAVQPAWTLLYRNDVEGNRVAGSKAALFAAIRSGLPIQIGWGGSFEREGEVLTVEHLVSPVYVTIANGREVTAQLPEHIAQRAYIDPDRALFADPSVMWRGLMTTAGSFDAVWVDRASGDTVRRLPQRAAMSWYSPVAPSLSAPTLAVPGGVTLDEARASERVVPE